MYNLLADLILLVHFVFILFVVCGGLLVLWKGSIAWIHIPALSWGIWIEVSGSICPLTPLENYLRRLGGGDGYEGSFMAQYLLPVIYPEGLTKEIQYLLAAALIFFNGAIYFIVWRRMKRMASLNSHRK